MLRVRRCLPLLLVTLGGCSARAEWALEEALRDATPDAGVAPLRLGAWRSFAPPPDGHGADLSPAAHVGDVLLAIGRSSRTPPALLRLDLGALEWLPSGLTLPATEHPTYVTRDDLGLLVTSTSVERQSGSLHRYDFGRQAWTRFPSAPALPLAAVLKKRDELLLSVAVAGAVDTSGVYASADRGLTWTVASRSEDAPLLARGVHAFTSSPATDRIFATVRLGPAGDERPRLAVSDDRGRSWATMEEFDGVDVLAVAADDRFALVQTGSGLLRSENFGATFHKVAFDGLASALQLRGPKALAVTPSAVRVSDDAGETWRDASGGLAASGPLTWLYLAADQVLTGGESSAFVAEVQD